MVRWGSMDPASASYFLWEVECLSQNPSRTRSSALILCWLLGCFKSETCFQWAEIFVDEGNSWRNSLVFEHLFVLLASFSELWTCKTLTKKGTCFNISDFTKKIGVKNMDMHMFLASLYPPLKRKTGQSLERERKKKKKRIDRNHTWSWTGNIYSIDNGFLIHPATYFWWFPQPDDRNGKKQKESPFPLANNN